MAQGVVYLNADGFIILANPAAEKILGLPLDEMLGARSNDPRWKFVCEDGREFPQEQHPSVVALRTGQKVIGVVMGIVHPKDEQQRWLQIDAIPEFRVGGSMPHQAYVTLTDITDRKHAEQQLEESEARYQLAISATDAIAYVSHRARTGHHWQGAHRRTVQGDE